MSVRGRGTLVVKPSNNPFFQSTQADIGYFAQDKQQWKSPLSELDYENAGNQMPDFGQTAEDKEKAAFEKGNFSFLYARTSDAIGGKVPPPSGGQRLQPKSKAEFLRDCYKSSSALAAREQSILNKGTVQEAHRNPEDVLKSYVHNAKFEDARYTTTNNEIGKRVPTVATFVSERHGIPQDFSNSFNNIKPQNTSLNTGKCSTLCFD